jgi:hypothetical protein
MLTCNVGHRTDSGCNRAKFEVVSAFPRFSGLWVMAHAGPPPGASNPLISLGIWRCENPLALSRGQAFKRTLGKLRSAVLTEDARVRPA